MANPLAILQQRYGLSAAQVAGLANASGDDVPDDANMSIAPPFSPVGTAPAQPSSGVGGLTDADAGALFPPAGPPSPGASIPGPPAGGARSYEGASLFDVGGTPRAAPAAADVPMRPPSYDHATVFDVTAVPPPAAVAAKAAPHTPSPTAQRMTKLADNSYDLRERIRAALHGDHYVDLSKVKGAEKIGAGFLGPGGEESNVDASELRKRPQTAAERARELLARSAQPTSAAARLGAGHWSQSDSAQGDTAASALEAGQVDRDTALIHEMGAADKRLEAARQDGMAEAVYAAAHAAMTKQTNDQLAAIAHQRSAYVEQEQQKLSSLAAETQAKVDPEAYWKERGSGARVLAAIAIGLGQFGALMRGGNNNAYDIIKGQIDANIRAQEVNVANAKHAYDVRSNLYAQNLAAFGDRDRAALVTKINYLDQVSAMANQQHAAAKGTTNMADWLDFKAKIDRERADSEDRYRVLNVDRSTKTFAYSPLQGLGGASATKVAREDARYLAEAYEKAGIPEALTSLEIADQTLDTLGKGDIAGVGPIKDHLPSIMLSDEGVANRQALASAKSLVKQQIGRAARSPQEAADLSDEVDGAHDAPSMRRIVQHLRRLYANAQRNIAAGAGLEGRDLYGERGGSVRSIPLDKPTTPYLQPVGDE